MPQQWRFMQVGARVDATIAVTRVLRHRKPEDIASEHVAYVLSGLGYDVPSEVTLAELTDEIRTIVTIDQEG